MIESVMKFLCVKTLSGRYGKVIRLSDDAHIGWEWECPFNKYDFHSLCFSRNS